MKCYLINLERSKDRLSWFMKQSRDLCIVVERVDAVDGCRLENDEIERVTKTCSGLYQVEVGAIGCYLSHRKVWEIIAAQEDEWAFVCEDDLRFSQIFPSFLSDTKWIPSDADIVKAETSTEKRIEINYLPATIFKSRKIQRLHSAHRGTAGYFIRKAAAQRLIKLTERKYDPVDELMFNPILGIAQQNNIYQINPAVCIQGIRVADKQDFLSDIPEGSPRINNVTRLGKIFREVKRLLNAIRRFILRQLKISEFLAVPFE